MKMACYCTLTLSMSLSSGNNQLYYKCRILLHNMLHKMGQSCFISVIQLHLSALHQISFIKFMTGNNVRVMLLMRTALDGYRVYLVVSHSQAAAHIWYIHEYNPHLIVTWTSCTVDTKRPEEWRHEKSSYL